MPKGFQPGHKKHGGRKEGTPNKANGEIRRFLTDFFNEYKDSDSFKTDLAALDPRERVRLIVAILPYVTPKLQSVDADVTMGADSNNIADIFRQLAEEVI